MTSNAQLIGGSIGKQSVSVSAGDPLEGWIEFFEADPQGDTLLTRGDPTHPKDRTRFRSVPFRSIARKHLPRLFDTQDFGGEFIWYAHGTSDYYGIYESEGHATGRFTPLGGTAREVRLALSYEIEGKADIREDEYHFGSPQAWVRKAPLKGFVAEQQRGEGSEVSFTDWNVKFDPEAGRYTASVEFGESIDSIRSASSEIDTSNEVSPTADGSLCRTTENKVTIQVWEMWEKSTFRQSHLLGPKRIMR